MLCINCYECFEPRNQTIVVYLPEAQVMFLYYCEAQLSYFKFGGLSLTLSTEALPVQNDNASQYRNQCYTIQFTHCFAFDGISSRYTLINSDLSADYYSYDDVAAVPGTCDVDIHWRKDDQREGGSKRKQMQNPSAHTQTHKCDHIAKFTMKMRVIKANTLPKQNNFLAGKTIKRRAVNAECQSRMKSRQALLANYGEPTRTKNNVTTLYYKTTIWIPCKTLPFTELDFCKKPVSC